MTAVMAAIAPEVGSHPSLGTDELDWWSRGHVVWATQEVLDMLEGVPADGSEREEEPGEAEPGEDSSQEPTAKREPVPPLELTGRQLYRIAREIEDDPAVDLDLASAHMLVRLASAFGDGPINLRSPSVRAVTKGKDGKKAVEALLAGDWLERSGAGADQLAISSVADHVSGGWTASSTTDSSRLHNHVVRISDEGLNLVLTRT